MYVIYYNLDGVKGDECHENAAVESMIEAKILASKGCSRRLGVLLLYFKYVDVGEYDVYVKDEQMGTVRIKKLS